MSGVFSGMRLENARCGAVFAGANELWRRRGTQFRRRVSAKVVNDMAEAAEWIIFCKHRDCVTPEQKFFRVKMLK